MLLQLPEAGEVLAAPNWELLGLSMARGAQHSQTLQHDLLLQSKCSFQQKSWLGWVAWGQQVALLQVFYCVFLLWWVPPNQRSCRCICLNRSSHVASGLVVTWHRKHGGEIWCSNGCWNSPEGLSLGGIQPQWRPLHDLLLKVICSGRKEKHKCQNGEITAQKKSEWPKYWEKVLRDSLHFLSYVALEDWRVIGKSIF